MRLITYLLYLLKTTPTTSINSTILQINRTIRQRLKAFFYIFNSPGVLSFFYYIMLTVLIFSFILYYKYPIAFCSESDASFTSLDAFFLRGHNNRIEILKEVVSETESLDKLSYIYTVITEALYNNYSPGDMNPFINDSIFPSAHYVLSPSDFFKAILLFIFFSILGLFFIKGTFLFFPTTFYQEQILLLLSLMQKDPVTYMDALSSCYENLMDSGFFDESN